MSTYPAERHLPSVTPEQLPGAACRAKAAACTPVSYLRFKFLSGTRPATACSKTRRPGGRRPTTKAGIPYERIVHVVHVAPEDLA